MKSLNVKKLAAIAAGAALVGSAVLPMALGAATVHTIEKSDIYDTTTGSPVVNVVVGANSGVSDALWAGNIAATIAKNAVTTATPTCTTTGGGAAGTCSVTLGNVELTVGGTVTYEGAKDYKADLNSNEQEEAFKEVYVTNSNLSTLYNETVSYKWNGSTTSITEQEKLYFNGDAKFDTGSEVKDLVMYFNDDALRYVVDLGSGIPVVESTSDTSKFTDDTDDHIPVVLFGEQYIVSEIDLNTNDPYIKLVKSRNKETYKTGESFTVPGAGDYAGQTLTVTVTQIVKTSDQAAYQATFQLTDANGNVIDTQTVSSGEITFQDAMGNDVTATTITVETVAADIATNEGYVELYKGTNAVTLYHGKGYPDESETTPDWVVRFEVDNSTSWTAPLTSVSGSTRLTGIEIYNANLYYDSDNPVYSKDALLHDAVTVSYPNNYATLEFEGFESGKTYSTFTIEDGYIKYKDASNNASHEIPFYVRSNFSTQGATFTFDGQTYWVKRHSSVSVDLNGVAATEWYLDGSKIQLIDQNSWRVACDGFNVDNNITGAKGSTGDFNLCKMTVPYTLSDTNVLKLDFNVGLELRKEDSTGQSQISDQANADNRSENSMWYLVAYTSSSTLPDYYSLDLVLKGASDVEYKYVPYVWTDGSTYKVYFLLRGYQDKDFYAIEYPEGTHAEWSLRGDYNATKGTAEQLHHFYVPDTEHFNRDSSDDVYYAAIVDLDFDGDLPTSADTNVIINEATGKLFSLPNTDLGSWAQSYNVYYNADDSKGTFRLSSDTTKDSSLQKAYTAEGSKYEIDPSALWFKATIPEEKLRVKLWVKSTTTTEQVTGGEELTVAEGETVTTSSGTKITVKKVNYSCTVTDGNAGTCECTVTPESYEVRAPGKVWVYLDTEAPAGKKIVVGGWIVNSLAPQDVLEPLLTAEGDYAVYKDETTGNIYVAGYTAEDTAKAAQELINQIEGFA